MGRDRRDQEADRQLMVDLRQAAFGEKIEMLVVAGGPRLCDHRFMRTTRFIMAAITLAFTTNASVAANGPTPANTPEPKPGEGVLCLWALTSVASEVGRHCSGKSDPAFQTALEGSVALMDEYVLANGHIGAEGITKFKSQQGGVGQSTAELCTSDKTQLYDHLHAQGAVSIKEGAQKAVARPGMPTWGDCL